MTKLTVTRELVGKVVCSSYVTHQKVIRYSWVLVITRAYSPMKLTSFTIALTAKTAVELVNFTCEWPNSQLDPPLVASLCRLVVIHSAASYVVQHGRKSVASHLEILSHANLCRVTLVIRGGRVQVVGRSLIDRKASKVSQRLVASVSRRSGRGRGSGARLYVDRLTNVVRARKSACRGGVASHSYNLTNYTLFVYSYVSRSPKSM